MNDTLLNEGRNIKSFYIRNKKMSPKKCLNEKKKMISDALKKACSRQKSSLLQSLKHKTEIKPLPRALKNAHLLKASIKNK